MKMSDESYYRTLDVIDRIKDEAIKKFTTLGKFSRACGKHQSWFYVIYGSGNGIKLSTLINCARVLDVSIWYFLCKEPKKPFSELNIDVKEVMRRTKGMKRGFYNIRESKWKIMHGLTKDITLQMLFNIQEVMKKDLHFFLDN